MMKADTDTRNWSLRQRLEFIERQVYWGGEVKRSHVREQFDISEPQAAKDFREYKIDAPDNLEYDASAKAHVPSAGFVPRFWAPDADEYLAAALEAGPDKSKADEVWVRKAPQTEMLPRLHRQIDPGILRHLVGAISEKQVVSILYQSMNPTRPERTQRMISPHAFGSDGQRWHVRAWCHEGEKFKDFIISRIFTAKLVDETSVGSENDTFWNTRFEVILEPNPALSEGQQKAIEADYNMTGAKITVTLRQAMLYYFDKRFGFDIPPGTRPASETPIVIANRRAYEKALKEATA